MIATTYVGVSVAAADRPTVPDPLVRESAPKATVEQDASSYSIGLVFGSQLRTSGLDHAISLEAVHRGLEDGLKGKAIRPEDRDRAMALMRSGREALAARNHTAAQAFLASNLSAAGVKATASGLQYEVLREGDFKAASPTETSRVTVHFRGRLLDGTEFDSSDAHAQSATFAVNAVIKGWHEALLLMKPGAQWRLFVPPELAYDRSPPPAIPPGSLLIFDLELLRVEAPSVMHGPHEKARPPAVSLSPGA